MNNRIEAPIILSMFEDGAPLEDKALLNANISQNALNEEISPTSDEQDLFGEEMLKRIYGLR